MVSLVEAVCVGVGLALRAIVGEAVAGVTMDSVGSEKWLGYSV